MGAAAASPAGGLRLVEAFLEAVDSFRVGLRGRCWQEVEVGVYMSDKAEHAGRFVGCEEVGMAVLSCVVGSGVLRWSEWLGGQVVEVWT